MSNQGANLELICGACGGLGERHRGERLEGRKGCGEPRVRVRPREGETPHTRNHQCRQSRLGRRQRLPHSQVRFFVLKKVSSHSDTPNRQQQDAQVTFWRAVKSERHLHGGGVAEGCASLGYRCSFAAVELDCEHLACRRNRFARRTVDLQPQYKRR